jgi:hypothetical protein
MKKQKRYWLIYNPKFPNGVIAKNSPASFLRSGKNEVIPVIRLECYNKVKQDLKLYKRALEAQRITKGPKP